MQNKESILNIQKMERTFLVKQSLVIYSLCSCIDMNLLKKVADDLLKYETIEIWRLLRLTGRKAFVNGSHCSKLQSIERASEKQPFTFNLGLRIISINNLQLWGMARKRNGRCSKVGIEKFKMLISLEKTMMEHNFKHI